MYSENQIQSLRKKYNRTLWSYIGIAALSVAATALLIFGPLYNSDQMLSWLIAAWIGLLLAVVEYVVERALYKKGKKGAFLLTGFLLGILFLYVLFAKAGLIDGVLYLFYPLLMGFLFSRPLIPAVGLLRDARRLRDGDPCETVGRMKSGSRREEATAGRDTYLLFEDELTHEVRILRMGSVSPLHRYRVFYLPHSGLAVGEAIPDNVTFDPFGNPVERAVEDAESVTEKPDYTEESYTVKPEDKEEPAEKPWYQNPEAFSNDPPKAEPRETETTPDPNSPERQRAAKFGVASKVCKVLTFALIGVVFISGILLQDDLGPSFMIWFLPLIVSAVLQGVFKDKELKLRCTKRATGFCIDTVRRRSGKHSTRHPIVEFEAGGVTHTAELQVSCSRDAVGDIFTLYYDPLDPATVRTERRGLFE